MKIITASIVISLFHCVLRPWLSVVEEYGNEKVHYEKLNIGDRIEIGLFDEGHAVWPESAIPFLTRWLKP